MWTGDAVAQCFAECGITHVVWIPDSVLGTWDQALSSHPELQLVRVCREGEAFAVAAGLHIGGKNPIVLIQCTGFFEAGDALRNAIHDMKLPLFFLVGVRNWHAHREGKTADTCPVFTEPVLQAWNVPYALLQKDATPEDFKNAYLQAQKENRAGAVLLAE